MPLLGFKNEFADMVQNGIKTQTIRKKRKHPVKAGDRLYCWTNLRNSRKKARKLGEFVCKRVDDIYVTEDEICVNGEKLNLCKAAALARCDGFLMDFYPDAYVSLTGFLKRNYGLPFEGVVIHWEA